MSKDEKQSLPIEKYKHFKGIYIERTKEFFLCDFYEISMPDKSTIYKVLSDINKRTWMLELHTDESGKWKFIDKPQEIPIELEAHLSDCILKVCLNKEGR